jgi:hypothetical protein
MAVNFTEPDINKKAKAPGNSELRTIMQQPIDNIYKAMKGFETY